MLLNSPSTRADEWRGVLGFLVCGHIAGQFHDAGCWSGLRSAALKTLLFVETDADYSGLGGVSCFIDASYLLERLFFRSIIAFSDHLLSRSRRGAQPRLSSLRFHPLNLFLTSLPVIVSVMSPVTGSMMSGMNFGDQVFFSLFCGDFSRFPLCLMIPYRSIKVSWNLPVERT